MPMVAVVGTGSLRAGRPRFLSARPTEKFLVREM